MVDQCDFYRLDSITIVIDDSTEIDFPFHDCIYDGECPYTAKCCLYKLEQEAFLFAIWDLADTVKIVEDFSDTNNTFH